MVIQSQDFKENALPDALILVTAQWNHQSYHKKNVTWVSTSYPECEILGVMVMFDFRNHLLPQISPV